MVATRMQSFFPSLCMLLIALPVHLGAQSPPAASGKVVPAKPKAATAADSAANARRHVKRAISADDIAPRAQPLPTAPPRATATPRTPSANASGALPTQGPFLPVAIRTRPLTLTGTGVAELTFRFMPVAVRTSQLTLTGTGVAETTHRFTRVVVRTPRLTLTGTGRVE